MLTYKNILFATLGTENDKDALKQAVSIARNHKSSLTILLVSPVLDDEFSEYAQIIEGATKQQLDTQVAEVTKELGVDTSEIDLQVKQQAHVKPMVAIVQSVIKNEHDLLIKTSQQSNQRAGFKALDMELLRKCPCPVWLCKPIAAHREQIKVAVAIDAFDATESGTELSVKLLKMARAQANECDGKLRVISNINTLMQSEFQHNVFLKLPQDKLDQQSTEVKSRHLDKLNALVAESGIAGELEIVQLQGTTDQTIPKYVSEHCVDILVMGTIARSGVAGVFIGNTAENIIQQLDCSLLTVKPRGFISPVKTS
ncbi:MAG: universal stress protein [Gammaproteobacteria bacterium]|nr:universal stress protein [Gammaproteobacteria bacterium]